MIDNDHETVFVVDNFDGSIFQQLQRAGCRIVSPAVIMRCAMYGEVWLVAFTQSVEVFPLKLLNHSFVKQLKLLLLFCDVNAVLCKSCFHCHCHLLNWPSFWSLKTFSDEVIKMFVYNLCYLLCRSCRRSPDRYTAWQWINSFYAFLASK